MVATNKEKRRMCAGTALSVTGGVSKGLMRSGDGTQSMLTELGGTIVTEGDMEVDGGGGGGGWEGGGKQDLSGLMGTVQSGRVHTAPVIRMSACLLLLEPLLHSGTPERELLLKLNPHQHYSNC